MPVKMYDLPVPSRRPYKSYRFDVFSLKAGRRMTLYGKATMSQFIELEADPDISAVCERPLSIPNHKPQRIVDFWALRVGRPAFYLLSSKAPEDGKPNGAMDGFRSWVKASGGTLHEIPVELFHSRRVRHANWTIVLQHLVAHRGQVTSAMLERCALSLRPAFTLAQLEDDFAELDPMLARAAVFQLLAGGQLRCPSIDTQHLCAATVMERV